MNANNDTNLSSYFNNSKSFSTIPVLSANSSASIKRSNLAVCSYNQNHLVKKINIFNHERNCPDKGTDITESCPCNLHHRVFKSQMDSHIKKCPNKPKRSTEDFEVIDEIAKYIKNEKHKKLKEEQALEEKKQKEKEERKLKKSENRKLANIIKNLDKVNLEDEDIKIIKEIDAKYANFKLKDEEDSFDESIEDF